MKQVILAAALLLVAPPLFSQHIAVWDFENITASIPQPPLAPSSMHPQLSEAWAGLSGANNIGTPTACAGNESWASNFWPTGNAHQPGFYYSFTVKARPGYQLEVYSFRFSFSRSSEFSANRFYATVSIDGEPEIHFLSGTASGTSCQSFGKGLAVISQSGGEVEFRVYFYGQHPASLAATVRIDDIQVRGAVPLPVDLTQFRGIAFDEGITLHWTTASESRNAGFRVERSYDGEIFRTIGQVRGAGDSHLPQHYSFTDERPFPGVNYYRLQQEDHDGSLTPSMIISVISWNSYTSGMRAFPNPFQEELLVQLPRGISPEARILITPICGGPVQEWPVQSDHAMNMLHTPHLPPGAYLLMIRDRDRVWSQRLIKMEF